MPAALRILHRAVFALALFGGGGNAIVASAAEAIDATPEALATALRDHDIVVLGEVHDNAAQHRLRFEALKRLVEGGARPALAFEQFDRQRQPDIDRARRARPRDAAHVIELAKSGAWEWKHYQPFVQLALDHDLPIVAANLSRQEAMQVMRDGYGRVFDGDSRAQRRLAALPEGFVRQHELAIAAGHCGLLPASALPAMARAQIARDFAMAAALRPYRAQRIVLLAGNGHARADIGVPFWLNDDGSKVAVGIGMLEAEFGGAPPADAGSFDFYVATSAQARPDPCQGVLRAAPGASAR